MTNTALPVRVGHGDDSDELVRLIEIAFHTTLGEELREAERGTWEPERSLLIHDGPDLVAHVSAFTRELTVPGATVPAAHVSGVAVLPTHRRRGLLTRLMRRQLRELRDAGREPVAVLWASEGRIYPRFGYGLAARELTIECATTELRLPAVGAAEGRLRLDRPASRQPELARLYDRVRADRPGWSDRDDRWWRYVLGDPTAERGGATERHVALHEGPDGGIDGYALWRSRRGSDQAGPYGVTIVEEMVAATPVARLALWRLLVSLDLVRRLSYRGPVDEPLLFLVDEPRRLEARLADALWVRVVDVPAALAARRYAAAVDLVVEVTDDLLPENAGRWRLTGGPDGARCVPTDRPADLACDVRALGELYLGGTGLTALADAGRVDERRPGALAAAGPAFTWHRAPSGMGEF
ncbi:GNAT family N-acetyltransferase [Micromonospora sp. RTGN7]|uniref:GNAT family N-acetyltransferase n=1 Tax=Micromonospora sp. RTGN7 TaxID=3016526 RepID=UPI0029FF3861|nr:GNAT family N-acetyltransferase [Micromonospora sp. RTGN7]